MMVKLFLRSTNDSELPQIIHVINAQIIPNNRRLT